ncbi:molybdopterin-containing oxidoreductase family protein [Jannaschia seohaensis]|uniref:Anaerobic selenocysteine-containing dehydrogenase n=1 Tax=Jannaschia seohaensis TaxID=475081 RepID=A0A2Y9B540_9RHOB|nr:molybdopterin-dependent oxidoreductase [Jannaschia seohaensis]PWJ10899.1 anaerobic selenocysteine-containing dehydrogenase [Jannaschia seohaensis]SSA51500.1 Anaerobic selenocysteine-containing dehydrogenase [Jannaschia seohaensis]
MANSEVPGCCPHDCQDGCSWVAHVEDGQVTKVVGNKQHLFTRGILCAKINDYQTRAYAPDRLLHPLRRTGAKGSGEFERISWDEAIHEIAAEFGNIIDDWGSEALMPLHDMGSAGALQRRALMRLFHHIGASRLHGSLCGQSGNTVAAEGHPISFDPETIANSECILLWGANLLSTAHHHWHFCLEARKARSAKIISIDPRRTRTAAKCDEHIPIRPGTDAFLAAGIANVLVEDGIADFEYARSAADDLDAYLEEIQAWTPDRVGEITGVAPDDVVRIARVYGAARPGTLRVGIGPQQSRFGDVFVKSLSALAILSGHWRLPGGGLSIEGYPTFDNTAPECPELSPEGTRSLHRGQLGQILTSLDLDPPIKGLMVWGHNPVVNQIDAETVRHGLCRNDLFTVVIEHFMTDTARHADIVLPSTTQLEHFDVQGSWGQCYVGLNKPAIPPMGEAKPHTEILRHLASKMGLDEPALFADDETTARSCLPDGFDWETLNRQGWLYAPQPRRDPASMGGTLKMSTALDGPEDIDVSDLFPDGRLRLLTVKPHYLLNSTFANMPRQAGQQGIPTFEMNPADAANLGLQDGDRVVAHNGKGTLPAILRVTDTVVRGTTVLEGKFWWTADKDGSPVSNRLAESNWTDGGQPTFNDIFVKVTAAN